MTVVGMRGVRVDRRDPPADPRGGGKGRGKKRETGPD